MDYFAGAPWAVIEPWQPQVGQRVRCVPSPECQQAWNGGLSNAHACRVEGIDYAGHLPDEYGKTGLVVMVTTLHRNHPYVVKWDEPIPWPRALAERLNGGSYAAYELEPL